MTKNSEGYNLTIAAMKELAESGGRMGRSGLLSVLEKTVASKRREEKDTRGNKKWVNQLDAVSSRYVAEGLIAKENRTWILTPKGSDFIRNFGKKDSPDAPVKSVKTSDDTPPSQEQSGDKIAEYIKTTAADGTGKKLEHIAAALLRGMGYQHAEVCGGRGDGGVDVVAYKDKLGATPPRLKVQTKHYTGGQTIRPNDVRELAGVVREGEIGVFITTSSFTPDARREARGSEKHILLIDIDRLVELWVEYYPNMTKEDKQLIPLKYELDENELEEAKQHAATANRTR